MLRKLKKKDSILVRFLELEVKVTLSACHISCVVQKESYKTFLISEAVLVPTLVVGSILPTRGRCLGLTCVVVLGAVAQVLLLLQEELR